MLFVLHTEEVMTHEGAEADEVAGEETKGEDDDGKGEDNDELYHLTIEGLQAISIRQQESWQEEIVQQIDIQSSCSYVLQRL